VEERHTERATAAWASILITDALGRNNSTELSPNFPTIAE
jgi:hypothetical protein